MCNGDLAKKDLNVKTALKPKLIPITHYQTCRFHWAEGKLDMFRILADTVLILSILYIRRRVGDV